VVAGARMKREGMKAGVFDLHLPLARDGYHGLWIELKTKEDKLRKVRKGVLSESQKEWQQKMIYAGHNVIVLDDFEDVKTYILNYLRGQ
jgi:hypothetical protein